MADHAVNIAEAALECIGLSTAQPDEDLLRLFEDTIRMVDGAIRSFIDANAALGREVCEADTTVDQLATEILERVSASMTRDPFTIRTEPLRPEDRR